MPGPWGRLVESISSKLAFFPPQPPTYEVATHDDNGELYIKPLESDLPKVLSCTVKWVNSAAYKGNPGGSHIITAYVPCKSSTATGLTILYSHGNAVDLGQMLPVYREISKLLKVSVMGYDYTGYGCSSGEPSVSHTFTDIWAVYQCLRNTYNIPANRIVVYGQSVGSGPSSWLGAEVPDLAGVVLHSPILSGVRVLKPQLSWWPAWADVYPNHLMVPRIECPVLVMHGTEDEVIHISCGQKLASLVKNKYPPLWAQGYNHQNIEMCPEFLPTLSAFLTAVGKPRGAARPSASTLQAGHACGWRGAS